MTGGSDVCKSIEALVWNDELLVWFLIDSYISINYLLVTYNKINRTKTLKLLN